MKFAKEGYFWVGGAVLLDIGWHIISLPAKYNPWTYFFALTLPTLFGIGLLAAFFRDPKRVIPPNHIPGKTFLSPSDGIYVNSQEENGDLAIYIEMHLNHVHVTRAHLNGTVKKITRSNGKHYMVHFFRKTDQRAITKNGKAVIDLEDEEGRPFEYYLICGAFFRRAKPYVKVGDFVHEGQRIGIIQFGSTTRVTLPGTNYKIVVKPGARVKGGQTIICEKEDFKQ